MNSLMLKAFLARNAKNTTRKIREEDYIPTCMTDCDYLWDTESLSEEQTLEKGKSYCFGIENDETRGSGNGFVILNGDNIDLISYDYGCNQKKSVKNIYGGTTPSNEGRLFKLKSNKDQTIYFRTTGPTSFTTTSTDINGIETTVAKHISMALENDVSIGFGSMFIIDSNSIYENLAYMLVWNPNQVSISAQNEKGTAKILPNIDTPFTEGEEIGDNYETQFGYIITVPSEIKPGTYETKSTITLKQNEGIELPEKFIELTPDTIFSKNDSNDDDSDSTSTTDKGSDSESKPSTDKSSHSDSTTSTTSTDKGSNDSSNSKTTTKEESDSKTGLIVGVVVGVVVVVAIVVFCVYWYVCRTKSDDKEETPNV